MSRTRKLLFITHNFPPIQGGISIFSWELCRGFQNHGFEVRVLTSSPSLDQISTELKVETFSENVFLNKFRRLFILRPLNRILSRWCPDLIFLASHHPYGFLVRTMARLYGIPYVLGSHGLDVWRLRSTKIRNRIQRYLGRRTLEGARVIFSVSHHIADLVRSVALSSIEPVIIHNGTDTSSFSPGPGIRTLWSERAGIELENKFVLCSVSSLRPLKGHKYVLEALAQLPADAYDLVYLIAGSGSFETELKKQVERFHLTSRVAFLGPVDHDQVPDLLRSSDLLIQNSLPEPGEGFGIVFLEANACGLPVIGSKVGGIPDAVKDGQTGLLIDPEKPTEIAAAIETLILDRTLREKMGQNGIQWAREHDWSKIVTRYINILDEAGL